MLVKTQLYLDQKDYDELRQEAFDTKQSMSEIVRHLIRGKSRSSKKIVNEDLNAGRFMMNLAKKYSFNGPKDLATNLNAYLYGKKR